MTEKRIIYLKEESDFDDMWNIIFSDLNKNSNYSIITEKWKSKYRIIESLKEGKLSKLTGSIFSPLFNRYHLLPKILKDSNKDENIVLFTNSSLIHIKPSLNYLRKIKENYPNTKFVLFYLDIITRKQCSYANYLRENKLFDLVYSFDKEDAMKINAIYWDTPYSKQDIKSVINTDLYFCTNNNDILDLLEGIIIKAKDKFKFKVDLITYKKEYYERFKNYKNVNLKDHKSGIFSYNDILQNTINSKCILEIVRDGQKGNTLRTYEAIVYNKKLLTNNKEIVKNKYYNPEYMKVFNSVDEIDLDWLKNDSLVDYHYEGDYSPIKFCEDILKRI